MTKSKKNKDNSATTKSTHVPSGVEFKSFSYGSSYGNYYQKKILPAKRDLIGSVKPDLSLLTQLVEKQSPSNTQELYSFLEYLIEYLFTNIDNIQVELDETGNILVTKGESEWYPCIVAHTDTNQDLYDSLTLLRNDDIFFGWDNKNKTQVGPGFDDKVGIMIALQALKHFDVLKVFFPINEEVGYIGSGQVDMSWFDDVSYCIQPDRNSYSTDFITYTNGVDVCSKEFIKDCQSLMSKYGYKTSDGLGTDIGELKCRGLKCSAINVSCGYFREHTKSEICSVSALHNCLNFVFELIETLGTNYYEHKLEDKKFFSDEYPVTEQEWDEYMKLKYGEDYDQIEDTWYEPEVNYEWKSDKFVLAEKDYRFIEEDMCPLCITEMKQSQSWMQCPVCYAYYWKVYDDLYEQPIDKSYKTNKTRR